VDFTASVRISAAFDRPVSSRAVTKPSKAFGPQYTSRSSSLPTLLSFESSPYTQTHTYS